MKKQVLIRGVDDQVYRRAKANAAILGLTMGAAVGEALRAWVAETDRAALEQELSENQAFVRKEWDKMKRHQGKTAVVAKGTLQGVFDTRDEARKIASGFRMALTFTVEGAPERHELEIGPEMAV